MRYPPDLLDEIRSRLPVSRVVERKVKLKRSGREFQGLSPFKNERTPSFTVNDQKGFYHCFASGEHGDIFKFVMVTEGLAFHEAVERLAAEAGVPLPAPKSVNEAQASHESRLRDASEEACRFYEASLSEKDGAAARAYLARRGVQPAEVKAFRLGFAPDSKSALKTHLTRKGFRLDEMQDAGLLIHGEGIVQPYDRFRGRLMFPIGDAKGRVIAFGGRALHPDQQPKYLNSPDTALFHKGRTLYNHATAREIARTTKTVIVSEGYMDVIALTRAGFNAVAPLGTALTPDQLRLLWTMAPLPSLCFDGDTAGQKAASRALDGALPFIEPGRSLEFVFLPEGRDPDDMVSGGSKDVLAKLLANPIPLIDVLWSRENEKHPLKTPEQRAALEARLMELCGTIEHKSLKFHYISALRDRLRSLSRTNPGGNGVTASRRSALAQQRMVIAGGRGDGFRRRSDQQPAPRTASLLASTIVQSAGAPSTAREALLITALLRHPWLLDDFVEDISAVRLNDPECDRLRNSILTVYQAEEFLDNQKLIKHLLVEGYGDELERIRCATSHIANSHFALEASKDVVLEGLRHILLLHQSVSASSSLQEAENDYLNEPTPENFSRLRAIVQQSEFVSSG